MTELLETAQLIDDDVASIIARVDLVLASLPASDPLREDLLEIRTAAQLAVAKTEQLLASVSFVPLRRAS